jgi:uncharacterized membrane protein
MVPDDHLRELLERVRIQEWRIYDLEKKVEALSSRLNRTDALPADEAAREPAGAESASLGDWEGAVAPSSGSPSDISLPAASMPPPSVPSASIFSVAPREPVAPAPLPRAYRPPAVAPPYRPVESVSYMNESEYKSGGAGDADARILSETELPACAAAESAAEPVETVSWEVRLATTWLPRLGGVLLLAGAAFGATLIHGRLGPPFRVGLGFVAAVGIVLAGWFVQRRSEKVGRVTIAIGASLAYFISFASHYIKPMEVFPAWLSVGLMLLFVGSLVGMAERWKSEAVAGMGFFLGVLASLISAQTSREFALVALGVLALGAGVLLVRNEWKNLTALILAGTYLATLVLWVVLAVGRARGEILTHLGALACYHLIFTVAFWRWGRVWVARERAVEEAAALEAIPSAPERLLPYSTAFAMINSLAPIALGLLLLWQTKTYWPRVHYFLFVFAAAEAVRVIIPGLRRGPLGAFHSLMAFALVCGGLVSAFSGLSESAVLAVQALVVAIAASRSRLLRWLRPLTAVCAGLAVVSFRPKGITTPFDFIAALTPGLLLLASTLSWEAIWVRRPKRFATGFLGGLESVSGQFRAVVAAGLLFAVIEDYFSWGIPQNLAVSVLILALLFGMVVLRARAWFFAALAGSVAGLTHLPNFSPRDPGHVLYLFLWLGLLTYGWQEFGRDLRSKAGRVIAFLAALFLCAGGAAYCGRLLVNAVPYVGALYFLAMVGAVLIGSLGWKYARLPPIVSLPETDDEEPPPGETLFLGMAWHRWRFGYGLSLALLFCAVASAIALDAQTELTSALVMTAAFGGAWYYLAGYRKSNSALQTLFTALALVVAMPALLVFGKMGMPAVLGAGGFALAMLLLGLWKRNPPAFISGYLATLVFPAIGMISLVNVSLEIAGQAWCGLGVAAMCVFASRALVRIPARLGGEALLQNNPWIMREPPSFWLTASGALLALVVLAEGILLRSTFITVGWGVIGIALLVCGFVFLDRPMRFTSLGVFLAAVGRIFLHDLTGVDMLTRAVAFVGVGLVLVGAGVAYGFWRSRVQPAERRPKTPPESRESASSSRAPWDQMP